MPVSRTEIENALRAGPLILDGAIGTELERRGVPLPAPLWSAAAIRSHPQILESIHLEYAEAGARILVANTFRTNPRTLRRAGMLVDGPELNREAVAIARRAAISAIPSAAGQSTRIHTEPPDILVAGSVAPVEDCYRPDLVPSDAELAAEHAEMVGWLGDAGVDLIWIETMNTSREAVAAVNAASSAGFPFVLSFVFGEQGDLLSGDSPETAIRAADRFDPLAIGVNCIPPSAIEPALRRIGRFTTRPLVAYGHVHNAFPIPGWTCAESADPAAYADAARSWLDAGARIVGGCCGTTPMHIAILARVLSKIHHAGPRTAIPES